MKPVTKWAVRVSYPERVPWAMRRAFSLATNGQPGPIYLDIPFEVGNARAEMADYSPAERYIRPAGDPVRVAQAAALLAAAKRPLIVAGGGVTYAGANAQLAGYERMAFVVVADDRWTIEGGQLTPTMKIKRGEIEKVYAPRHDEWYAARKKVIWL